MRKLLVVSAFLFAVSGYGAEKLKASAGFQPKVGGSLKIGPTYVPNSGLWHSENSAEVHYNADQDITVGFNQDFNTAVDEIQPFLKDAFFYGNFANVWTNKNGTSLFLQPRLYVPTNATKRDNGQIFSVLGRVGVNQDLGNGFAVTVQDSVIKHTYSRSGNGIDANPAWENWFAVVPSYSAGKFSVAFPINWEWVRFAAHNPAGQFDGTYKHTVFVNPGANYRVADNASLGLEYWTGNLSSATLSTINIGEGIENGKFVFIFRALL